MARAFDPGYCDRRFADLCEAAPDGTTYPPSDFRVEWGPVFHRGRLDGSARVLVIGQDPAAHEAICRRILVGEAGKRVQGLLGKLGITVSYAMTNALLYSQVNSDETRFIAQPGITEYRNRWIDAILASGNIRVVLLLGDAAQAAWDAHPVVPGLTVRRVTHPTEPHKDAHGHPATEARLVARMLDDWNQAVAALRPQLDGVRDTDVAQPSYGTSFRDSERPAIPSADLPAGLPDWMGATDGWAVRTGPDGQRWQITVTVPVPFRSAGAAAAAERATP
ncbi:MAG TPA: uracil-DNA glycosylase family protein [Candidatus Dormibacteraeota bacterium]|nr:uracil-DNA glycosylase family protein [Candidatus Dormibacteraeota bacterium]